MKISKRFASIASLCVLVFGFFVLTTAASSKPPVPIFTRVESVSNPYISGTTASGTEVLVYIDGVFAGVATITGTSNDISDFYYKYSTYSKLTPGKHYVFLTARDKKDTALVSERTEEKEITIPSLLSPTITSPTNNAITVYRTPWIEVWGPNNSYVNIYIDNVLVGRSNYLLDPMGNSVKYVYKPTVNYSLGWHKAYAMAENGNGSKSLISNVVIFKIEEKLPKPVLLSVKPGTSKALPVVSGLAANDLRVKIYNNDKELAQVSVKNGDKGTGSFGFTILKPLTGKNVFKAIASDRRGKLSQVSNTITYDVAKTFAKKMVSVVDTDKDGLSDYNETNKYKTDPKNSDTDGDGYKDGTEIQNGYSPLIVSWKDTKKKPITNAKINIKKTIKPVVKAEKVKNGTPAKTEKIAEEKEQPVDITLKESDVVKVETKATSSLGEFFAKNKSKINLIVFILFLCGVVGWIFWVNREIIKEKAKSKKKPERKEPEIDMDDEPKLPL